MRDILNGEYQNNRKGYKNSMSREIRVHRIFAFINLTITINYCEKINFLGGRDEY